MRMFKILKANNLPISMQLQSVNDNFDKLVKKTVEMKGGVNTGNAGMGGARSLNRERSSSKVSERQ